MVRSKIPGGRLTFQQARAAARINKKYSRSDVHITTRQDFQFYFVSLNDTPAFLEGLHDGGITTREASGNTFRNIIACPLAGICPHEKTDASKVAEELSRNWIRHPLVQHMPRKFKTTVSGCGHDCGASAIDDLGFIATTQNDKPGFKVVAGGGLGNRPHTAIVVEEFVEPQDLPAVQEAFARLHQGYSNRENKNVSRIKFLVDKFGEEGFVARFRELYENIQGLPRRVMPEFEWRSPDEDGPPPSLREGEINQHDGNLAILVRIPLGMIDSARLQALTDTAEGLGASEFRLTRDQNILVVGLAEENRNAFVSRVKVLGFEVGRESTSLSDLVSCPGTSTCPIGITNSNALARDILADKDQFDGLPEAAIRISGCHNSCGQHHIGDIGLHSLAKKINGRSAPHYQFHVGGDGTKEDAIGIAAPIVPARLAKPALKTLWQSFADTGNEGEGIRAWVDRIGLDGLAEILQAYSVGSYDSQDPELLLDVGSDERFYPPLTTSGECAASAVVGEYLADLAQTALLDISRRASLKDREGALQAARDAVAFSIKRLLLIIGEDQKGKPFNELKVAFFEHFGSNPHAVSVLKEALEAIATDAEAISLEESIRQWIVVSGDLAEFLIPKADTLPVSA